MDHEQPPAIIATLEQPPAIVSPQESEWDRVLRRVRNGETVYVERVPGEPKGRYKCYLFNGVPTYSAVPGVTATPFQHHAGHDCPGCGRTVKDNITSGKPNVSPHVHRCPSCGTSWWH